jgi:hypothetical protein
MYTVDDPLLTLLARFVGADIDSAQSAEAFMQSQVDAVHTYVVQFPEDQREDRALRWVEGHARQYREQWQRNLADLLTETRCADCPLVDTGSPAACEIHERWAELLRHYVGNEISSREYVEFVLKLLAAHKARLRVSRRARRGLATP